jgi:hypothetical protein
VKLRLENNNLEIYTVDTDEGCGIIRIGNQKLLTIDKDTDPFNYSFLENNRKKALNLISVNEFKSLFLN